MSGLTLRTLRGFKWQTLATGGSALVSLATVMILARLLTPQDFGQLAVAQAFITLAGALVQRGLGLAIVQRFALTRRHVATGLTLALASGALLAAAVWALAPWLVRLVGAPDAEPVVRALAPVVLLTGAGLVSAHRLRRHLRFRALMAADVASRVIGSAIVAVALALLEYGVWALVWGALAHRASYCVAVLACAPPRGLGAGRRETVDLVRTGAGFSALAMTDIATKQSLRLLIAGTLGAASLGLFTRARSLSRAPARLGRLLNRVLLPAMSRRQRRLHRLRPVYLNGVELAALAALPASLLIALTAPEIVRIVLGRQWEGAVPVLSLLSLTAALQAIDAIHAPVIRALGAVHREAWRRALYLALLLAAVWTASPWGLAGVAAALAAARLVLHALLVHQALGLLGIGHRTLLRRYVPALWTAAWATAALWPVAAAVRAAQWPTLGALALELAVWGAAAGASAYLAPSFARPYFPHWGLVQLPFDAMGRPGRWTRRALRHLARRWPTGGPGGGEAPAMTGAGTARPACGPPRRAR